VYIVVEDLSLIYKSVFHVSSWAYNSTGYFTVSKEPTWPVIIAEGGRIQYCAARSSILLEDYGRTDIMYLG
jgi:hypothetical protein